MISKLNITRSNSKGKSAFDGNSRVLIIISAALFLAFVFNTFVISNSRVVGSSMAPLLNENDWIITNRLEYINSKPSFGDVIVFKKKSVANEPIVKRIIGIQDDIVEIINGVLYVNNNKIENDFAQFDKNENMVTIKVPQNCYFVVGDNKDVSNDSRIWKYPYVRSEDIIGKVTLKYFPGFERVY